LYGERPALPSLPIVTVVLNVGYTNPNYSAAKPAIPQ
jgi:hypothetical protein